MKHDEPLVPTAEYKPPSNKMNVHIKKLDTKMGETEYKKESLEPFLDGDFMNCPKCAAKLSPGAEFCGLCGSSSKPVTKSVPALKEEAKISKEEEVKASKLAIKATKKPSWRRVTIKLKKKLKELNTFQRGRAILKGQKTSVDTPHPLLSQREILTNINEQMGAVATPIRTGEIQIIEEPAGGLASIYDLPKEAKVPPLPAALTAIQDLSGGYGVLVSASSIQAVSKPPEVPKRSNAPPPIRAKKAGDFEEFGATETAPAPIRINTLELEIIEDPTEQRSSAYSQQVDPKALSDGIRDPAFVGPVVIHHKRQSSGSQDSGEIAISKTASKSRRFIVAALAVATGAVGMYIVMTPPSGQDNAAQFVAAATPSITVQPTTVLIVANDAKIADAATLALQGKWEQAAALAEEAQSPDLAKRYRIEAEVSQNLKDCRKARDEKKLEEAMAACHLVELVEGSRSAQMAASEIEELKKSYKSRHVPLTKKEISRGDLVNAKQEIQFLSLYLGQDNSDTIILQRLYSEQVKKLSAKDKIIALYEPSISPKKSVTSSVPQAELSPVSPTPPTATPAPGSGAKAYSVNGVLVSLGGFTNKTKDPSLTSKFQSAVSRNLSSAGKLTTSAGGKGPLTISGSIVKVETKTSGGKTSVSVGVSLQITRDSALLGAIYKEGASEFSGTITAAEEKAGQDAVIKDLADNVFSSFKASLNKFK
jgi:hypothetical protein